MIALPDDAFHRLRSLALAEAGLDLKEGKRSFVASRLQKRLRATGSRDFDVYAALVEGSDEAAEEERQHLISALTTNVTSLFREAHHFAALSEVLGINDRAATGPQRIWSAGCSTGEETLSLAMICRIVFGHDWTSRARILATDIDYVALSTAKAQKDDAEVTRALHEGARDTLPEFTEIPRPTVSSLQAGITYLRHSLMDPLTVSRPFDVIFCRNVTIYFAPDIQRSVQSRLVERLAPNGLLCLGHSERLLVENSEMSLVGPTTYARKTASFAEMSPCR